MTFYAFGPSNNPLNLETRSPNHQPGWGEGRVLRGGSWADQSTLIHRAANRLGYDPKTPFSEGIAKLVKWYNASRPSIELPENDENQVAVVTPEA